MLDGEPLHLLVGSTGLKLCGKGECLLEKHGTATRRSWRMLHPGVDAGTGRIVASTLTPKDADNASQVGPLQNASGYNKRARVEAAINRWKQVIGNKWRARTDERRATKVAVAVHALSRMPGLGRPSHVRVA